MAHEKNDIRDPVEGQVKASTHAEGPSSSSEGSDSDEKGDRSASVAELGPEAGHRKFSKSEIEYATRNGSIGQNDALRIVKDGGWEVDALMASMEEQRLAENKKPGLLDFNFSPKVFTILLVCFASMGGLLSGLDQSLISGANLYLPRQGEGLGLNPNQLSLVNSGMPLGAVGGALLLSPCNEYFGRWWSIMISIVLYTIGAGLEAGAVSFGMMMVGRLVLGLGVGLEGGTVPAYVAETSERRLRGNFVSLYQFNIALGEVLGYAVAAIFIKVPGNWRYILGSSLVFSTIMAIGMLFLPESPRWLMHHGRTLEAYKIWRRIRGTTSSEAREEFFVIKSSLEQEEEEIKKGSTRRFPFLDLITKPRGRRAFVYANIMIFLGQFTGVNAILYFLSTLMHDIGFDDVTSNYLSLVGGGSLLIGTIPAVIFMDRFGRRFWAIAMLPGFFVGLVLVGVSYHLDGSGQLGLYFTGLILYEMFFGSYATLTWVIPSEVFPTYLRSYGLTSTTATLFLYSFIVTYNFTRMQTAFTPTGLLVGFYGGIAVLGWFYQIIFMPETKDKTLEEINLIFEKPTMTIVRENMASSWETTKDLAHLRLRKVFAFSKPREDMAQGQMPERIH